MRVDQLVADGLNTRLALATAEFARERGKYDDVRIALPRTSSAGATS